MIVTTKLTAWIVEKKCEVHECNGSMVRTGATMTKGTEKTLYHHLCNECSRHDSFEKSFPKVQFGIVGAGNGQYPNMVHAIDEINK